jgi:hypothetical protein
VDGYVRTSADFESRKLFSTLAKTQFPQFAAARIRIADSRELTDS